MKLNLKLIQTTDSEEDDGSSATLVDELLSDVAENCSGIFEYPEDSESEEHNKLAEKWYLRFNLILNTFVMGI